MYVGLKTHRKKQGCCGVASVFLTPFPHAWMKAAVRNIFRYCKVLQCAYALEDETVKDYSVETMDVVTMLFVELWISILKPRFFGTRCGHTVLG